MAACKAKSSLWVRQEDKSKGRRSADRAWHPDEDKTEGLASRVYSLLNCCTQEYIIFYLLVVQDIRVKFICCSFCFIKQNANLFAGT